MPKYKLNYFDIRGFGEIPRLIFHYAGQEFEDRRWAYPDWPLVKHGKVVFTKCTRKDILRFVR